MGFFDDLFSDGSGSSLSDRDLAEDMLKDAKFGITALAESIPEINNPELRQMLARKMAAGIEEYYTLSDLVQSRGWYVPYYSPERQLQYDIMQSTNREDRPSDTRPDFSMF